jgi:guanosine-3',5'-bis(diphosphate) 3'-pyrophosphohydrolase
MKIKDISRLLQAVEFSAEKHKNQRRKDQLTPYINHPISVARMIWEVAGVHDMDVIVAAILHDTVEDTDATFREIRDVFGDKVAKLVQEVSDDKSLPKEVRKKLQIDHADAISQEAKIIKIADKICNMRDLYANPPEGWSAKRKKEYLEWAKAVVDKMRGVNSALEQEFDKVYQKGIENCQ